MRTGGVTQDVPGLDLTGVIVGSEGTFGLVTEVIVRLTRNPATYRTLLGVFESVDDATQTVSDIIAAGIVPGAMEMMDKLIVGAVEDAYHFGFPRDAEAVLIVELDGLEAGIDRLAELVTEICNRNRAREVRKADTRGSSGWPYGNAASGRSVRSGGFHPVIARRMAWCREPSCPRSSSSSGRPRKAI